MATHSPLDLVLSRLSYLNVSGCVPNKPREIIGIGGFGDIYKGYLTRIRPAVIVGNADRDNDKPFEVAIKSNRAGLKNNSKFEKAFCKELYIWSSLEHANIVKLHGFMIEDDYPSLILEWVSNGTVIEYVKANSQCDRVKLCQGIADGIEYLHVEKNVIHSDLKGSNILVNGTGVPMLTDFGLARMTQYTQACLQTTACDVTGSSVRWTAYENFPQDLLSGTDDDSSEEVLPSRIPAAPFARPFEQNQLNLAVPSVGNDIHNSELPEIRIREEDEETGGLHTKESDIWAFGMVIYEIITEDIPYSKHKQDVQVMFAIIKKKRPEKPKEMNVAMKALWNICKGCWIHIPLRRLKIRDVIKRLSLINPEAQGQILSEEASAETCKRKGSHSSFPSILDMNGPEEAVHAHPMPEPEQFFANSNHMLLVCLECKRLQLNCDRRMPCSACMARDIFAKCIYSSRGTTKKASLDNSSQPSATQLQVESTPKTRVRTCDQCRRDHKSKCQRTSYREDCPRCIKEGFECTTNLFKLSKYRAQI